MVVTYQHDLIIEARNFDQSVKWEEIGKNREADNRSVVIAGSAQSELHALVERGTSESGMHKLTQQLAVKADGVGLLDTAIQHPHLMIEHIEQQVAIGDGVESSGMPGKLIRRDISQELL